MQTYDMKTNGEHMLSKLVSDFRCKDDVSSNTSIPEEGKRRRGKSSMLSSVLRAGLFYLYYHAPFTWPCSLPKEFGNNRRCMKYLGIHQKEGTWSEIEAIYIVNVAKESGYTLLPYQERAFIQGLPLSAYRKILPIETSGEHLSLEGQLAGILQSKDESPMTAEHREDNRKGRPSTPHSVLWYSLVYPYLSYTQPKNLPVKLGCSWKRCLKFRKSLQKARTWYTEASSTLALLREAGIFLSKEQEEAFLQGHSPITSKKSLSKEVPSLTSAQICKLRKRQIQAFREKIPQIMEDCRKLHSWEDHFCLLPFQSGAEPGSEPWAEDVDKWREIIQKIHNEIRERNPIEKNKERINREEIVWKYIELCRPILPRSSQHAGGHSGLGRPPCDPCLILGLIVIYKLLRGGTWDELEAEILLRNKAGEKMPSLSTCKRYWRYLKDNPDIFKKILLYLLYMAKELGILDLTVCLMDATDFESENYHELVGWGYKEGNSMRIMAISTVDKILLGYILVRPDTSEVQHLLPTLNELPDFIQKAIQHMVADKAYDSTMHRTKFNDMGKFLHAENRSCAKGSKLTSAETAVNKLAQLSRHGVENVFRSIKYNRIFSRFREKTSESVRTHIALVHMMHLLGVLYKKGVRDLQGFNEFSENKAA